MPSLQRLFLLGFLSATISVATAADSTSATELPTLMTERGKLLFSENFQEPLSPKIWRTAKGKWDVADGVLTGAELKSDNHGAVTRHPLAFHDAIIQYSFRLDGAKVTTLSLNSAKEHVCRVMINGKGFNAQKDDHDHAGPDKAVKFPTCSTEFKAGQWYTLVVELHGKEMLARIGDQVSYGENEMIDVDKANFGFTVAGETASIKDVKVWEASPKSGWDKGKVANGKVSQ